MNQFILPEKNLYRLWKRSQGKADRQLEMFGCELRLLLPELTEKNQVLCSGEDGFQLLLSGKEIMQPEHILICEVEGEFQIIPSKDSVSSRWLKHLIALEIK